MKSIALLLLAFSTALLFSCTKDDEVEIQPGQLSVENISTDSYDIFVSNLEKSSQGETYAGMVNTNEIISLELEIGYTYQVRAIEEIEPGETPEEVILTKTIRPYDENKVTIE